MTVARAADSPTIAVPSAKAATSACSARLFDGARETAAGLSDEGERVVAVERVGVAGEGEVVLDVPHRLLEVHALELVGRSHALVERGVGTAAEAAAQCRLSDEQQREGRVRVHVNAGDEARLLELPRADLVGLVADDHHPPTALDVQAYRRWPATSGAVWNGGTPPRVLTIVW